MKERKIFKRTLSILVTIVLASSCFFGNYSATSAAETTATEKELVQFSNNWCIFKYTDETGEPTFDVKYQGKTSEELKQEGYELQYRLIIQNYNLPLDVGRWKSTENKTELPIPKSYCKTQFRLTSIADSSEISISDSFALESSDSAYVLSSSNNYSCDLRSNPNNFKLELKLSQHVETDNFSILVAVNDSGEANEYLLSHALSNITIL